MSEVSAQEIIPPESVDYLELDQIIEEQFSHDKENLIMILQAIQRHYNYLPKPALTYVSEKLAIPFSKIYEVATFYSTFSLEPRDATSSPSARAPPAMSGGPNGLRTRLKPPLIFRTGAPQKISDLPLSPSAVSAAAV